MASRAGSVDDHLAHARIGRSYRCVGWREKVPLLLSVGPIQQARGNRRCDSLGGALQVPAVGYEGYDRRSLRVQARKRRRAPQDSNAAQSRRFSLAKPSEEVFGRTIEKG